MSQLLLALEFATKHHKGQMRKGPEKLEYIIHPVEVARRVRGAMEANPKIVLQSDIEKAQIVALLHDTVEDTNATNDDIWKLFDIEVANAVALLTHNEAIPYFEYVRTIYDSNNYLAMIVKYYDIDHNLESAEHAIGKAKKELYKTWHWLFGQKISLY